MSETNYTPIQLYRTTTASLSPSAGNLADGELGINLTDEKLYFKNAGGTVKLLAANLMPVANGGTGVTTSTGSGSVVLSTSPTLVTPTLSGVTLSDGTANGVLYLNGSKQVTSGSALTFDGTNLGIGTASPLTQLQVKGATYSIVRITSATDNVAGIDFGDTDSADIGRIRYSNVSNGFIFRTNGSDAMTLDSSGNLGIGKSFPAGKLDVVLGTDTPAYFRREDNGYQNINISIGSGGGQIVNGGSIAKDFTLGNHTNGALLFNTNTVERMRLDSSGNLGLGVTPSAWNSSFNVFQIGATGSLYGRANTGYDQAGFYSNARFASGTNDWRYLVTATASGYGQAGGAHYWYTAPSGTAGNAITFTQAMTLDASGRLGVGTTSPLTTGGSLFEVSNSANCLATITCTNDTTSLLDFRTNNVDRLQIQSSSNWGAYFLVRSNQDMKFGTNNTERMRLDASGNLGLGVTPSNAYSGARTIEVGAGGLIDGRYSDNLTFSFATNAYLNSSGDWLYKGTGKANLYAQSTGIYTWSTAPSGTAGNAITFTQAMTLDSSGNLTIPYNGGQIRLASGSVSYPALSFAAATSTGIWNYYDGVGPSMHFAISGSDKMVLDRSGNLLVGTTSTFDNVSYLRIQTLGGIATKIQGTTLTTQVSFFNDNGRVGWVGTSGSSTSYNTSSDYRLKEDVQPVADAITRLNQLKPINFAWKVDGSRCDGFLAHELQEVIPEAATGHKDEMRTEEYEVTPAIKDEEGNVITEAVMGEREVPVYQGIDQSKIVPLLTAALQEAVAKIESQAQTIESLTQRIEALEYKGE